MNGAVLVAIGRRRFLLMLDAHTVGEVLTVRVIPESHFFSASEFAAVFGFSRAHAHRLTRDRMKWREGTEVFRRFQERFPTRTFTI